MPGMSKMNNAGLVFLKDAFRDDPNITSIKLLLKYNEQAIKRGWQILKSSGTIRYHLNMMGIKLNYAMGPHPAYGMAKILMDYGVKRKLAEKFKVSEVTVRDALKFKTKSRMANMLRKAALEMGGVLKDAKTLKEAMNANTLEKLDE